MVGLSVVIPIYNVQEYIERCARSLMNQTLKEGIEFIFVDDCSSDDSMEILRGILKDYPNRKSQIQIVKNFQNLGIYRTRCIGAEAATGKYIGWVDSDDWVEPDMFEKMLDAAESGVTDIVVCDYIEYRLERTTRIHFNASDTPMESIMLSISGMYFSGTLWNQIFRRELFVEHMYDIVPTNYSEDTYIIWHVYCNAHSIKFIAEALYHYDKRNQKSLMHSRSLSFSAWQEQEKNLICIDEKNYSRQKNYKRSLHYFMYWRKYEYLNAFDMPKIFYDTFRNASRDIFYFPGMTQLNRWKIFLINNCYLLFWIMNRGKFYATI